MGPFAQATWSDSRLAYQDLEGGKIRWSKEVQRDCLLWIFCHSNVRAATAASYLMTWKAHLKAHNLRYEEATHKDLVRKLTLLHHSDPHTLQEQSVNQDLQRELSLEAVRLLEENYHILPLRYRRMTSAVLWVASMIAYGLVRIENMVTPEDEDEWLAFCKTLVPGLSGTTYISPALMKWIESKDSEKEGVFVYSNDLFFEKNSGITRAEANKLVIFSKQPNMPIKGPKYWGTELLKNLNAIKNPPATVKRLLAKGIIFLHCRGRGYVGMSRSLLSSKIQTLARLLKKKFGWRGGRDFSLYVLKHDSLFQTTCSEALKSAKKKARHKSTNSTLRYVKQGGSCRKVGQQLARTLTWSDS